MTGVVVYVFSMGTIVEQRILDGFIGRSLSNDVLIAGIAGTAHDSLGINYANLRDVVVLDFRENLLDLPVSSLFIGAAQLFGQ